MGDLRYGFDVDQVAVGVAETLDEEGLGLGADGVFEVLQVRRIDEGGRDAVRDERMLQQVVTAAVDVFGGDDVVSGAGDVEDGIGDGGGTGSHGQGTHAPFQGSDPLLEDVLGRIGQAAVDVAGVGQAEARGGVLGIAEHVRRGQVDGDGACIGGRIRLLLPHVELEGFEMEFAGAHGFCICFCWQS